MNVTEYLESKGLEVRESGDNLQVNCPFCSDTRQRLGIHQESGKWNCYNCGEKGKSIHSLQKKLDDEKLENLELEKPKAKKKKALDQGLADKFSKLLQKPGRKALDYLRNTRGFKDETIAHFQLGSWKKSGYEYVAIPFWKRGTLVNMKYRAVNFKDKKFKWRRHTGGESCLFHHDLIDLKEHDTVFITEAELDCVSLWNVGIKNVIAVTTGAKAFKQEWYDELLRFKKIYLVYDPDVDGQDGAQKAANRLGFDRCFNVVIPKDFKDVNEFFWNAKERKATGKTLKDFKALVSDARKFEVRDTTNLREAVKELYKDKFMADEEETIGLETPWKNVNKIVGGSKPGHLVVVSAPPKIGKTTWVLNWVRYLAKEDEVSSFVYCCEMRPKRLAEKMIAMESPDFTKADEITKLQMAETVHTLPSDKIIFGYPKEDNLTLDNVCDRIKEAVQRYGCKLVVFDNLHFLVRGEGVTDKIGEVTRRFKLLAETLNVVFVLIVHPRKVGDKRMTADDLKDSSSIYQDLDTLIMLHRQRLQSGDDEPAMEEGDDGPKVGAVFGNFTPLTQVTVTGRWSEGGMTHLYFEGRRSLFHSTGSLIRNALKEEKRKFEDLKKKRTERTKR